MKWILVLMLMAGCGAPGAQEIAETGCKHLAEDCGWTGSIEECEAVNEEFFGRFSDECRSLVVELGDCLDARGESCLEADTAGPCFTEETAACYNLPPEGRRQ